MSPTDPPTAASLEASSEPSHAMQCMEVWGGNQAIDNGVTMPGLNAWVFSRPYNGEAAGGDVHYVSSCATGRVTRLLVADVSGHGQTVAMAAVSLRQLMRRYVNYVDQSKFVGSLNREFSKLADAGCFATALAATYWAPTDYLVACNAGHPRPLYYSAKAGKWSILHGDAAATSSRTRSLLRPARKPVDPQSETPSPTAEPSLVNLPLGVAEPTSYEQFSLKLTRGDLVLLYTDSLIEAKSPDGKLLGEQRLLDMVSAITIRTPQQLVQDLYAAVVAYNGGTQPDDDVTMLILQPNGQKPKASIGAALSAGWQITLGVTRSLLGDRTPLPLPEVTLTNIAGAAIGGLNRRIGRSSSSGNQR